MNKLYLKVFKNFFDRVFSLLLFLILTPIFILIAILIKTEDRGPIFFIQKRIGVRKNIFYILKFRTMKVQTPSDLATHLLTNPNMFLTKTGGFLRKTSLDELPQLLNILKGDMSFVGPRPALWNQYDLIHERDKYGVNSLKPGLTGWAQVNGRDELTIETKAMYDYEYLRKISFVFDLLIIYKTFINVIKQKGISG